MLYELSTPLMQGLERMDLELSKEQQEKLLQYISLLQKWNAAYNLTAIRDPKEMLIKHVFDALSVQSHLPKQGRFIDVGSGGGIPGLILAIADSSRTWTLLDSNGKKTRFLTQAVLELQLSDQVSVVHDRAENHQETYDGVIARAVTEVNDFISFTQHLPAKQGSWWMMKGVYPADEIDCLPDSVQVETVSLMVPELAAERWLVRCWKASEDIK